MLISIVVPIYKVEKYIHRCIDSILGQTFKVFELILVDDGSPDNCGKICDEYAEKDSRIHVIHKENGGLSDARNAGIDWAFAHSDSEWITFIDSDDWVHPQYLELLYDTVSRLCCDIGICEHLIINDAIDEQLLEDYCPVLVNVEDYYISNTTNAVVAWGKLYRKELFKEIRYPFGKIHEDEFTTYLLLFRYKEIGYIKENLYYYFNNHDGIINSEWSDRQIDLLDAIEEQIKYFSLHGFSKALVFREKDIIKAAHDYLLKAIQIKSDEQIVRKLKNRLKKYISKYKAIFPFVERNMWIYKIVYPKRVAFYYLLIGIKEKILIHEKDIN